MKTIKTIILAVASLVGCLSHVQAATPYPLAHKFTEHGVGKPDISAHPKFTAAPIPAQDYTLEAYVYFTNQGPLGTCGAFSASEAYDVIYQRDNGGAHCVLSYMDIYSRTTNYPQDAGVNNADLLKTMLAGNVLETTFPYRPSRYPTILKNTPAVLAERAAHVTLNGYSLPANDLKNAIKRCISQLHITPIIGTYWYNNQFNAVLYRVKTKDANGKVVWIQRYVLANPKGSPAGGHDITAVAFDDNMVFPNGDVGGIEFHNHWAVDAAGKTPWGDSRGCCWASYKFLANPKYADDVIAFDKIQVTPAKKSADTYRLPPIPRRVSDVVAAGGTVFTR